MKDIDQKSSPIMIFVKGMVDFQDAFPNSGLSVQQDRQIIQLLLPVLLQTFSLLPVINFVVLHRQLSFRLTLWIKLNLHHRFSIDPFQP